MKCPKCLVTTGGVCGHEIPGVYDGVVYWSCNCGHRWHRFPKNDRRRIRLEALYQGPVIAEMPHDPSTSCSH